jgi:hypothetical protein
MEKENQIEEAKTSGTAKHGTGNTNGSEWRLEIGNRLDPVFELERTENPWGQALRRDQRSRNFETELTMKGNRW